MNKKSLRKFAFAVCIVIFVLSVLCFVWAAWTAADYRYILQEVESNCDYRIINLYRFWYALNISVAIFELIVLSGTIFVFVYMYKNDFSIPKEERLRIADEKREIKKQAKKEKLQKQLEELDND